MVREIKFRSKENDLALVILRSRSGQDITADLEITADGTLLYMEEDGKKKK